MWLAYGVNYLCRSALILVVAEMLRDDSIEFSKEWTGALFAAGSVASFAGKWSLGVMVDRCGGRMSMLVGCLFCAASLYGFAWSSTMVPFFICWVSFRLFATLVWPGMIRICRNSVAPEAFPEVSSVIITSARTGSFVSAFLVGSLLLSGLSWRWTLTVAASMQLFTMIIAALIVFELSAVVGLSSTVSSATSMDKNRNEDHASVESVSPITITPSQQKSGFMIVVKQFGTSPLFWVVGIANLGLYAAIELESFIPLLLVYWMNASVSTASFGTSAFLAGSMVSVIVVGPLISKLSKKLTTVVITALLIWCAVCVTVLALLLELYVSSQASDFTVSWVLVLMMLFLVGSSLYGPTMIPVSIYAAEYGGPLHCAKISSLLDGVGYIGAISYDLAAGSMIVDNVLWAPFFAMTVIFVGIGAILYAVFFKHRCSVPLPNI
jgi:sugar phosphate permease